MSNFRHINRLMGTRQEQFCQMQNGDFDDRLGRLMEHVDPFWQDREETEMDIYHRQAPVGVGPDGEEKMVHTARTPETDEDGEPEHRLEATITASELLQKGQIEAEREALE